MSTPTIRKSRRKAWAAVAVLGAAFGLFLTIGVGSAAAATSCTYNGTFGELVILGDGASDTVTFKRTAGSGGFILVNGVTCTDPTIPAAASVTNVDTVHIDLGDNGADTVIIDNTSGRVTEPGATQDVPPETGLNDIEWILDDVEFLRYDDTNAAGAVTIGQANGVSENFDGDTLQEAPVPGFPGGIGTGCDSDDGGTPDSGDALVNLNAFPADNDADVWDCGDDLDGITINGMGGDDFITGKGGDGTGGPTNLPLTINGGTGNNEIEGGLGNDVIFANPGDVLNGNANSPTDTDCEQNDATAEWTGTSTGGDTLNLSLLAGGFTIVLLEDGSITITPAPAIVAVDFENVVGSAGNDTITGNSLDNFISGGPGNDVINGGGGNDVLIGGDGDDTLAGGLGQDCIIGNAGNDIADENAPLNADGTPGYGVFGNGADAIDLGAGSEDTVTYSARTNSTVVALGLISRFNDGADPNQDTRSQECDDVTFRTENALTGSGNDLISADFQTNASDNEFTPGTGNDQLEGGAGNDVNHEGSAPNGADAFEGDAGEDVQDYSARSGAVTASLDGAGNDGEAGEGDNAGAFFFYNGPTAEECEGVIEGSPFFSHSTSIEFGEPWGDNEPNAGDESEDALLGANDTGGVEDILGGSGNDSLTGNIVGNLLAGNAGNDSLRGESGTDRLNGGDGNDSIAGGLGNDAIDGGAGTDWVDYQTAGVAGVGVQVNLATGTASGDGADVLTAIENIGGSPFADNLRGDAGVNVINGRGGNDAIQGGGENDVINGGPGNDELNGNGGDDTVRGQSGADTLRGAGGDDVVAGDPGNDTVLGGGGDDKVAGGSGRDFMNGGNGVDKCSPGAPGLGNGDVAKNCES